MLRRFGVASLLVGLLLLGISLQLGHTQTDTPRASRALIMQGIDERNLVPLPGHTRPEATPANDRGPVADDLLMDHMLLQLRRPPEQERALEQFLAEVQNPSSPNFHKWLTPEQFGQEFGVAEQDLDVIKRWLQSQGFTVNFVYPSRMLIDFSGTARYVRNGFRTEIHKFQVRGAGHIANTSDPQIPAALAPVIVGVISLNNFKPHALHEMRTVGPNYTFPDSLGGTTYAMVPADLATIYNLNPLFKAGITGQGQTIALIEDTNVFRTSDWKTFRSTFGLSGYTSGSFSTVHPAPSSGPNNCINPGVVAPNDAEAILDAEWASAAAPNATILMASCADTATTFGGLIALQNLISQSPAPALVSISYGECETQNGAPANAAYNSTYQQAAAEGISIFVAAGDSGASGCDNNAAQATHGIGANAFASTPYNVAVGGTDFSDTYSGTNSIYWGSTNTSTFGSALSYIPEIPWNNSCAGQLVTNYEGYSTPYGAGGFCNSDVGSLLQTTVAGGGAPSACATGTPSIAGVVSGSCAGWPKPSWQAALSNFGNPNDGVRDTPDVSLFAADGLWGHYYIFCWSDTANGGASCSGAPSTWSGAGGTSFASPIMAGIQALVNQKTGQRQGNPNPVYYQFAAQGYNLNGSSCNSANGNGVSTTCVFYDVTQGDMDVNCTGTSNCYLPSGAQGVLSTQDNSYQPSYGSSNGWDFATGIGSVNAANLVNNWPTASSSPVLTVKKTHTGNFAENQQNAIYTVTVSDSALAGPTKGTVTLTETLPSGLMMVSMAGTGWTCASNSCTRVDVLNGGGSYPAITVTVNVAANATSPQVNQVSISGGGSATTTATDSTTIIITPGAPTGLLATAGNVQVSLLWNASSGATSYNVLRSTTNSGPYTTIATGVTATSYTDTGVINGTTYYYVVQAVNAAGTSPNSNVASATPCAPPAVPSGLSAVAGNGQVLVSWNASSGATSYNVKRSTISGSSYTTIASVTSTSFSDTGLTNGTTYYYVIAAVNACNQSGNTNQIAATPLGAILNGYAYRRAITIDHTKVPNTDQLNFPVLVSGTYSYLANTASGGVTSANGYDIAFTSDAAGSSPLPYEREMYSGSNGAVDFWVQVPVVSHSSDTVIYMFYGNSSITTDQSNPTGTWDSNYVGVWHFPNGTTLSAGDSTANGNNGTINSASATGGEIDGAASFNGGTSNISLANNTSLNITGSITIEAWVKTSASGDRRIVSHSNGISPYNGYEFGIGNQSSGVPNFWNGSGWQKASTAVNDNNWHSIAVSVAGSSETFYRDGATDAVTAGGPAVSFSGSGALGNFYMGAIDEVRVSNIARSADWIATEYNNQTNSNFYGISAPASASGAPLAPNGLTATAGNAQVSLAWNASTGATSYNVLRSTTSGSSFTIVVTGVAATSYTDIGLTNGTTYYYVVQAVNSAGTSANSNQASATPSGSTSWSNGYAYRRVITIDHTKVPNTDQLNFPVLVSGTYSYLANTAKAGNVTNANGYDIAFTSDAAGSSPLPYEREMYSGSNGAVDFWVQVPVVSHSSDTVIYMFYGNSSITTDQSNPTGTWDSNYVGVWHFPNGTTLSAGDSTANGNNGTINSASATGGEIDGAALFNNGSSNITLANNASLNLTGNLTIEAWIKTSATGDLRIVSHSNGSSPYNGYEFGVGNQGSGVPDFWNGNAWERASIALNDNNWHSIAVSVGGSSDTFYRDGTTDSVTAGGPAVSFSGSGALGNFFIGAIDEVRVSNIVRSADWIATEYNNQCTSSTFYTIGAATSGP